MIALLPLWRVMAWVGDYWRRLKTEVRKEELRWQDKTGAVGVGGEVWISKLSSASHQITRLAGFSRIGAILPFLEPLQGQA